MSMLEAALRYGARGWRVLPLKPRDKTPMLKDWVTLASADAAQIKRWWAAQPKANVGIATGSGSGVVVLDVDVAEGHGGEASLKALEDKHGPMPPTLTAVTGSGGYHLFFRYPAELDVRNSAGKLGAGLDVRGNGGYVVAAPSIHPNGEAYHWLDEAGAVAELPTWWRQMVLNEALKAAIAPANVARTLAAARPALGYVNGSDGQKRWAERELEEGVARLRAEPHGNRNRTARDVAYWVGRIIHLLGMSNEAAFDVLATGIIGWNAADRKPDELTLRRGIEEGSNDPFTPVSRNGRTAPLPPSAGGGRSGAMNGNGAIGEEVASSKGQVASGKPEAAAVGDKPRAVAWSPSATAVAAPEAAVKPESAAPKNERYLLTLAADDEGNAACVMRRYEGKFLFCDAYGWMAYTGTYWRREGAEADLTGAVMETLKARRLAAVAADREAIVTISRNTARHIKDCMYVMRSMCDVSAGVFDANPDVINCANGVVNLRSGEVTAHEAGQRFTYCLPTCYEADASCKEFVEFLTANVAGGAAVADWLQLYFGYCLTGRTRYEVMLYMYGKSRAGKGTVMESILKVMNGLAKGVDFSTFIGKRDGDSNNFDLAGLKHCRLVTADESNQYERLNSAKIKALTGGNAVRCSFKGKDFFEYVPAYKLVLVSNYPLNADPDDTAVWARVRVVYFPNSYVGREDVMLKDSLKGEASQRGILAWLVAGARRFYAMSDKGQPMPYPDAVRAATNEQRNALDFVGQWIDERCEAVATAFTSSKALHADYEKWCRGNGVDPKQQRGLTLALQSKGFESDARKVGGSTVRGSVGVGLKINDEG